MSNTQNPIATLETRATTESVTAATSVALKTGKPITGQYLFDRFCSNKADVSKMDVVINAVSSVDTASFQAALKDMVAIAEKHGDAAKKTAANHRSVLQNVYGAIKFANDEFTSAGFDAGKTGYHVANTLAKQVLKEKGIRWNGEKGKTAEQREQEAQARIRKDAIAQAMASTPQNPDESMDSFLARVKQVAEQEIQEKEAERQAKRIAKLTASIRAMCGNDLYNVIATILNEDDVAVTEEKTGTHA